MSAPGPVIAVCALDDGDGETVALAADYAKSAGAPLALLAVPDVPGGLSAIARLTGETPETIRGRIVAGAEARLAEIRAGVPAAAGATVTVRSGKPFVEATRHAIGVGAALLVKAAEPLDAPFGHLFASTDQHLMRKCPCPVWLWRPGRAKPPATVLAAVDLDTFAAAEPDTQKALNDEIVATAARLAAFGGGAFHLATCWDAPAEGHVSLWSGAEAGRVSRYLQDVEAERGRAMQVLVEEIARSPASGSTPVPHVVRGAPRKAIPALAATVGADLLVLGTVARTGVPGIVIGNTAEDILNSVALSVVTVKPPGFRSPLA